MPKQLALRRALRYSYPKLSKTYPKRPMAWRLHLTNQAIQRVDILPGQPSVVAAWVGRERVLYFDLESGNPAGEAAYRAPAGEPRQSARWQEFVTGLVAPNGAPLPFVRAGGAAIHTTEDGRMRLYHIGADLFLETEGKEIRLETGEVAFIAVGLDRFLGLVAALDDNYRLTIYQQHIRVGIFEPGLQAGEYAQPVVAVANGGGAIFVSDGRQVALLDSGGRVRRRLNAHYFIGRLACSPNGRLIATSDAETGVIRVYSGVDFTPTHQRHALDLLQEATQIQLIEDIPPGAAGVAALSVHNSGDLAFAVGGMICATHVKQMTALPRPQALL